MNLNEKQRHFLTTTGIFALALGLRLIFDGYLKSHYPFYDFPSGDVNYYLDWARAIALGRWQEQSAFIGLPLFPHFLALLYRLCLGNLVVLRLLIMALGALNCVLVYLLARRLFNDRIGLVAGILTGASFTNIYYDRIILAPTLLVSLSAVILLVLLERRHFSIKHWFLLGALLGLGLLGDGKFLFYSLLLFVYLALEQRSDLRLFLKRTMAPAFAGIMLLLVISGARNFFVYGEWTWLSPQSGLSLYAGNNPQANGYFENMDEIRPTHAGQDADQILLAQQETGRAMSMKEVSAHYRQKAIDFIVNDPRAFAGLLVKKTGAFLQEIEASADDLDLIFLRQLKWRLDINPFALLLPLAALGILLSCRTPNIKLMTLLIVSQFLVVLAFFFVNRFRASIFPFLIIYEVFAVDWLIGKIKAKKFLPAASALIFILLCLIINQPRPIDAATYDHLFLSKKGYILQQEGDFPMALVAYQQALKHRPQDANLLYNIGNVHMQLSNPYAAQKYYQQSLQLNPLHVDAYFNLGYAYELAGEHQQAVQVLKQALDLDPRDTGITIRIAVNLAHMGQCDQAEQLIKPIAGADPKTKELIYTCINNYEGNGQADQKY